MGKHREIRARLVIDWPNGRDSEPRIFSLAETVEEANKLEQTARRAFERELKDREE